MKVLKIIVVLIIILSIVGYFSYTMFVPQMVTSTIETGKIPAIIPKEYHPRIEETRKKVKKELDDLPEAMNKYQISFDELLAFAEQVENDEVLGAIEELKQTEITSSGHAFDIAMSHISSTLPQSGKVKEMFVQKVPVDKIQSEIDKMQDSELPMSVEVDLARRIAIQILKDRKEEIQNKLDSLHSL